MLPLDTIASNASLASSPNWPDWIQAVAAVFAAGAAIVAAVVGIRLLRQVSLMEQQFSLMERQVESAVQWNKLNAAFTYYNSDLVLQRESDAATALAGLGIDFHTQREALTIGQVDEIAASAEIFARVKGFLSLIEDYCTAVRIGAIDEDAAFAMNSALIMRWESVFRPFIDYRRVTTGDSEAFCEIEKLAKEWRAKENARSASNIAELQAASARLDELRGVKKKV